MSGMDLNTIEDIQKAFPDDDSVRKHFHKLRWGQWAVCQYCGNERCYIIEKGTRYKCANPKCYKKFGVTTNTMLMYSNLPLTKWMQILFLYSKTRGRVSSFDLTKQIRITAKTEFLVR
jgi:hypothetical protein